MLSWQSHAQILRKLKNISYFYCPHEVYLSPFQISVPQFFVLFFPIFFYFFSLPSASSFPNSSTSSFPFLLILLLEILYMLPHHGCTFKVLRIKLKITIFFSKSIRMVYFWNLMMIKIFFSLYFSFSFIYSIAFSLIHSIAFIHSVLFIFVLKLFENFSK